MQVHTPRPATIAAFEDKVVLLTGGTGSFGRAFAENLLRDCQPKKLIIFSRDELKQYEMQKRFSQKNVRYFIGDVRDKERLYRATKGVDIIIHAAALKQVPACEYNPFEAVKTNVIGAANVIDAAIDNEVDRVLALSTDKAVNPLNLYGATKLCAEKLFVQGNAYSGINGTKFACARYGNVVGSRGSVIPLFQQQSRTGRVTVTDARMTRFWITLQQGVQFVQDCAASMHGGEVFIPKLPTMNIMDLVEAIAPACEVDHTGIRPGEKLHEVLLSADEARDAVEFADMFVLKPSHPWWPTDAWSDGKKLDEGFHYSSDNAQDVMSVASLRALAAALPAAD